MNRKPEFVRCACAVGVVGLLVLTGCQATTREQVETDGVVTAPTGNNAFELQFQPIPLNKPGTYELTFENAPAGDSHALLVVDAAGPEVAEQIDKAGVGVKFTLVGRTGSLAPESRQFREGFLEGGWPKSTESWNAAPLEYIAAWFKASRGERFTMRIEVSLARELPGEVFATPLVRGGRIAGGETGPGAVGRPSVRQASDE